METKAIANDDELARLKQRVKELEAANGTNGWPANTADPIVIDLGRASKKKIKSLKKGRGKLLLEVADAIEEVRSHLPENERNALAMPIVLIYKRKSQSTKRLFGL